ncbi:MAG TPA: hypothetical protein VEY13_06080 [Rubrobacteraceae bacterium]|nr:hypothetical protein [Rubrobacteraceae bacterium]
MVAFIERTLLLTDRVPSGWTGERPRFELLKTTRANFSWPEALAPTPVAASVGPHYCAVQPFQSPGAAGTRRSALLAGERGAAPRVAGHKGDRLA